MTLQVLRPRRFVDSRGWFMESWSRREAQTAGLAADFCQDNHSYSAQQGTLRGLHFQRPPLAQSKLVRCTRGRVFDVAVDLRPDSPTFGNWTAVILSAEEGNQLFLPAGYAHGFLTLEDGCEVEYKVDAYYSAELDAGIAWNDPDLGIKWPLQGAPILSVKDAALPSFADIGVDFPYDGKPLISLSAAG